MSQKTKKNKRKLIFLVGLFVFVLILFVEVYLRVFYYEQLKTRQTSTNRIPDSLKVFNRVPNVEESYITPGVNNSFKSNKMGYVGTDFNSNKVEGIFRIALVGNSEAVGKQMHGANNYSLVLRKIFRENNMNIEFINCSREGTSKDIQSMNVIKDEVIGYDPDIILLENYGNSRYRRYVYEGYGDYTLNYDPFKPETREECIKLVNDLDKYSYLTWLYDMSYIVRAVCKRYVDKHSNWNVEKLYSRNSKFEIYLYTYIKKDAEVFMPTYNLTWEFMLTQLNEINSILNLTEGKLVLFTYSRFPVKLKSFFKENCINFLELRMYDYNYLPLNSKLEGHTNEIGHALIAERLFQQLILKNLLPKKIQDENN